MLGARPERKTSIYISKGNKIRLNMTFDVALLTFGVVLLLAPFTRIETPHIKVPPLSKAARVVAAAIGLIFVTSAFVLRFEILPELDEAKRDRTEIYEYKSKEVQEYARTIENLRADNSRLRTEVSRCPSAVAVNRTLRGRIQTQQGDGLPDAKVEVVSGSQVFSNVNGEFLIGAKAGETIVLEKPGYKRRLIIIDSDHLGTYQNFVLEKERS